MPSLRVLPHQVPFSIYIFSHSATAYHKAAMTASTMANIPAKQPALTTEPPAVAIVADGEAGVTIAPVDTVALFPGPAATGATVVMKTSVVDEPGATETTVVTKVNGAETDAAPEIDVAKTELEAGRDIAITLAAATEVALDVYIVVETAYVVVETLAGQLVIDEAQEVTVISSVV